MIYNRLVPTKSLSKARGRAGCERGNDNSDNKDNNGRKGQRLSIANCGSMARWFGNKYWNRVLKHRFVLKKKESLSDRV